MKTIRNYIGLAIKVGEVLDIPLAYLKLRRKRSEIDEEKMKELIESVKEGVIEPLIVREVDGEYEIIAGERRFLAAEKAGLISVPCRIIECSDADADKLWLVSNIQREDLPAIDIAKVLHEMMEKYDYSVRELARILGKSHVWVMEHLALLEYEKKLPKELVTQMKIRHVRALKDLGSDIREKVIEEIKKREEMPSETEIYDLASVFTKEKEEEMEKEVVTRLPPIPPTEKKEVRKIQKPLCFVCGRPVGKKRLMERLAKLEGTNPALFEMIFKEVLEEWIKDEYRKYREKTVGSAR